MSDNILIITPPDDTLLDGIRILHVELTQEQNQLISTALLKSNINNTIINYVWRMGDPVAWLLDKKSKSDVIFFNADAPVNGAIEMFIGYIAAQPNSYYFGYLKDLQPVNDRAIYNDDNIITILEKMSKNYE
jgi:hypothetical protein